MGAGAKRVFAGFLAILEINFASAAFGDSRRRTDGREHFSQLERKLQALPGVQSRIAGGEVVAVQMRLFDRLVATDAFGDIFAGHFQMHPAGDRAFGMVDFEEQMNFAKDIVHPARLNVVVSVGVAVHRIAGPEDT